MADTVGLVGLNYSFALLPTACPACEGSAHVVFRTLVLGERAAAFGCLPQDSSFAFKSSHFCSASNFTHFARVARVPCTRKLLSIKLSSLVCLHLFPFVSLLTSTLSSCNFHSVMADMYVRPMAGAIEQNGEGSIQVIKPGKSPCSVARFFSYVPY
jgi:hypothetical protein